jgi:DGQHR domain-containing protein
METIKLTIIKAIQPIGNVYVSKIAPNALLKMSTVDRRRIADNDEVLGIQRELRPDKVNQIKSYLSTVDATFPNSIIVNTTSEYIVSENEITLELKIDESTFTIIDGQHRVEGFRDNEKPNFELIVAIFKDLKTEQQAEIFSTINSQQTKVDPSHNLNLELDSKVYTPIKMMIEIAQSFNFDKESPWFNNIRLLGSGEKGIISLSAFVKPLLDITYPDKDYYRIKNDLTKNPKEFPNFTDYDYKPERFMFWEFYKSKDHKSIFKILYNYFSALQIILDKDWLNYESLLNKTTGYNAQIKLFRELFLEGVENGDLSYDFFFKKLTGLKSMNGTINSSNYGASGQKATNDLYMEMKKNIR